MKLGKKGPDEALERSRLLVTHALRTKLFVYYLLASFVLASLGYCFMQSFVGERVFGTSFRMFLYHWDHPFQYIAVVCFVFAVVAAILTPLVALTTGWRRRLAVVGIMLCSIVLASVPGGVLWSVHDMQAGYFPQGERFWSALWWGGSTGLRIGWLITAFSFPYNVLGLVIGYFVTSYGVRSIARSANPAMEANGE